MENQIFLYGSWLWPHHWHRAGLPQVQLALQVLSFSQVDTYDIWGATWPRCPPAHNSYFLRTPSQKGVWLWWLDQVCALVHVGCCCFSRAYQGVTVPLIYGLFLKQCSLSPTHYEFTFTYITACILHTNFKKRKKKAIGLSRAQKYQRFVKNWEKKHTSETIKEDCFCPLATALRCPLHQKKRLI